MKKQENRCFKCQKLSGDREGKYYQSIIVEINNEWVIQDKPRMWYPGDASSHYKLWNAIKDQTALCFECLYKIRTKYKSDSVPTDVVKHMFHQCGYVQREVLMGLRSHHKASRGYADWQDRWEKTIDALHERTKTLANHQWKVKMRGHILTLENKLTGIEITGLGLVWPYKETGEHYYHSVGQYNTKCSKCGDTKCKILKPNHLCICCDNRKLPVVAPQRVSISPKKTLEEWQKDPRTTCKGNPTTQEPPLSDAELEEIFTLTCEEDRRRNELQSM